MSDSSFPGMVPSGNVHRASTEKSHNRYRSRRARHPQPHSASGAAARNQQISHRGRSRRPSTNTDDGDLKPTESESKPCIRMELSARPREVHDEFWAAQDVKQARLGPFIGNAEDTKPYARKEQDIRPREERDFWAAQDVKQAQRGPFIGNTEDMKGRTSRHNDEDRDFWEAQDARQAPNPITFARTASSGLGGDIGKMRWKAGEEDDSSKEHIASIILDHENQRQGRRSNSAFHGNNTHPGAVAVPGFGASRRQASLGLITVEDRRAADNEDRTTDRENQDGEILLHATAVVDEGGTVPEVHAVPAPKDKKGLSALLKNRCFWSIIAILLIFVCIAAALLGVFLPRGGGTTELTSPSPTGTQSPTTTAAPTKLSPTPAPTFDVATIELVRNNSFDGGLAINDTTSPQSKALQWLLQNTDLNRYSDSRKLQRFALVTLYYSTNGTGWSRSDLWLSNQHECDWDSLDCNDGQFVTELLLNSDGLVGTIPQELALLANSITFVDLKHNSLSGIIPSQLGLLTKLQRIELHTNSLSGPIPTEIGLLKKVEWVELGFNPLSSSIPTELGLLGSLEQIFLSFTNLVGSIPTEIGQLMNMRLLHIAGNNLLTGMIPTHVGELKRLKELWFYNNTLTGTIPTQIGELSNLELLWLHNNRFTGTVPTEVNVMTNLSQLYLYNNNFSPPFDCPSFIMDCYISCIDFAGLNSTCRELPFD